MLFECFFAIINRYLRTIERVMEILKSFHRNFGSNKPFIYQNTATMEPPIQTESEENPPKPGIPEHLKQKKAKEDNFQYICTFNSDMLPTDEFSEGFDIKSYVRLKLDDKDPSDSLLGFRY